jgi:hypothetical protein
MRYLILIFVFSCAPKYETYGDAAIDIAKAHCEKENECNVADYYEDADGDPDTRNSESDCIDREVADMCDNWNCYEDFEGVESYIEECINAWERVQCVKYCYCLSEYGEGIEAVGEMCPDPTYTQLQCYEDYADGESEPDECWLIYARG